MDWCHDTFSSSPWQEFNTCSLVRLHGTRGMLFTVHSQRLVFFLRVCSTIRRTQNCSNSDWDYLIRLRLAWSDINLGDIKHGYVFVWYFWDSISLSETTAHHFYLSLASEKACIAVKQAHTPMMRDPSHLLNRQWLCVHPYVCCPHNQ